MKHNNDLLQNELEETLMAAKSSEFPKMIWKPSESLTSRIQRLRQEYFYFYNRYDRFANEVRPYTTGRSWDEVYSFIHWGVTPECIPFFPGFKDTLRALAEPVAFPDEIFSHTIAERRAYFLNKVLAEHLTVKILD